MGRRNFVMRMSFLFDVCVSGLIYWFFLVG